MLNSKSVFFDQGTKHGGRWDEKCRRIAVITNSIRRTRTGLGCRLKNHLATIDLEGSDLLDTSGKVF